MKIIAIDTHKNVHIKPRKLTSKRKAKLTQELEEVARKHGCELRSYHVSQLSQYGS